MRRRWGLSHPGGIQQRKDRLLRYWLDYRTKRGATKNPREERESDRLFRLVTHSIEKTAKLDPEESQAVRIVRVVREESDKTSSLE